VQSYLTTVSSCVNQNCDGAYAQATFEVFEEACANVGDPISIEPDSAQSTVAPGPIITPTPFNSPPAHSVTPSSMSTSSSTPIGAIIGGAVGGGIALLLIAGGIAFFLLRRSKQQRVPSADFAPSYGDKFGDGRPVSAYSTSPSVTPFAPSIMPSPLPQQQLYYYPTQPQPPYEPQQPQAYAIPPQSASEYQYYSPPPSAGLTPMPANNPAFYNPTAGVPPMGPPSPPLDTSAAPPAPFSLPPQYK